VVTLIVVPFLARLPAYYTALQTVCTGAMCGSAQPTPDSAQPTPDSAQAIQRLGLSVGAYAAFTFALTLALAFVCFAVSAVIFWRKSDDWMALLVALAVVATVTLNGNDVYGMNSAWGVLSFVLFVLGTSVYVLVLALFPDGRFVPRWMRWLLPCWAVAALLSFMSPMVYTLVCCISLAGDRTSLPPSLYSRSTPAPAGQVVTLQWMCGSDHHSRDTSATVSLPFTWASWLVLSASHYTCLSRTLAYLPDLHWPCHSALPAL
jgi:hypothetical protein